MARRRRVARSYDRSTIGAVGERLRKMRERQPSSAPLAHIVGPFRELIRELVRLGWTFAEIAKELKSDLPGLTAGQLKATIEGLDGTAVDPSKAALPKASASGGNTTPAAPASMPTASAARDAPKPAFDGAAGFGRETA